MWLYSIEGWGKVKKCITDTLTKLRVLKVLINFSHKNFKLVFWKNFGMESTFILNILIKEMYFSFFFCVYLIKLYLTYYCTLSAYRKERTLNIIRFVLCVKLIFLPHAQSHMKMLSCFYQKNKISIRCYSMKVHAKVLCYKI